MKPGCFHFSCCFFGIGTIEKSVIGKKMTYSIISITGSNPKNIKNEKSNQFKN